MEGIALESHPSWKVKLDYPKPEPKPGRKKERKSPLGWIISFAIIIVAAIYLFRTLSSASSRAQFVPVDILAENATRNVESAATNEAYALLLNVPRTQTAAYYTSMPITQTQARITPTVTITPAITLTSTHTLTVVSIPVQIVDVANVPMVLVPGGGFTMGNNEVDNASPETSVELEPYYIDQFEVSNASYQTCVLAGACQPPTITSSQTPPDYYGPTIYTNYPVINLDWNMARTFCEWRGARLPTETEWGKAARGSESLNYPWGDLALCRFANYTAEEDSCIGDTQPVDRYMAGGSAYNVYNMAGNVAEWVESLFLPYP